MVAALAGCSSLRWGVVFALLLKDGYALGLESMAHGHFAHVWVVGVMERCFNLLQRCTEGDDAHKAVNEGGKRVWGCGGCARLFLLLLVW